MTLVYSFLFCGLVCLIGQLILDNTTLTPGHIICIFVVSGTVLGCFGLYDKISTMVGAGASIPIMSFGNILVNSAYDGFTRNGILGLFGNMFNGVGVGITSAIVFGFLATIFFKPQD